LQDHIVQENYGCFEGRKNSQNMIAHGQPFQGLFFSLNFPPETSSAIPASRKTVNASRERGKSVRIGTKSRQLPRMIPHDDIAAGDEDTARRTGQAFQFEAMSAS
jgi:hypothetical protein